MDFIKILLNIKIVIRTNIFRGVSVIDATTRRETDQVNHQTFEIILRVTSD